MELLGMIQTASQNVISGLNLADIVTGTVTSISPLSVRIYSSSTDIPAEALILTENVVPKMAAFMHNHELNTYHVHTVPANITNNALSGANQHNHTISSVTTDKDWETQQATEDYIGQIQFQRGLQIGDAVIMLRVLNGQRYIILSRTVDINGNYTTITGY